VITRRIRFSPPRKIAERLPSGAYPVDQIIKHEDGWWSVWHDTERFPTRGFAQAVWFARRTEGAAA
jgi:hypothetical protein